MVTNLNFGPYSFSCPVSYISNITFIIIIIIIIILGV